MNTNSQPTSYNDLKRLARYLEWKTETLTKEGTEQC